MDYISDRRDGGKWVDCNCIWGTQQDSVIEFDVNSDGNTMSELLLG